MAEIQKLQSLVSKLRARAAQARKDSDANIVVGFTAAAALYVHENTEEKLKGDPRPSGLGVYWGPHGQSKFLEGPARQMNNDGTFSRIVVTAMRAGKTLAQALLLCGLRLERESQERVPVEYGNLRASAFTRVE
jgi:hypothetical protein